jgi:hypothetical protein
MMAATGQGQMLRLDPEEAMGRPESGAPVLVLDVRSPQAWDAGGSKIQGPIRVPPARFHVDSSWPKDRFTLVYCT